MAQRAPDGVKNYSEALLFFILLDMVHRDALREGDAEALVQQTKFHMPFLWKGNHNKYLICERRFLAGMHIQIGNISLFVQS